MVGKVTVGVVCITNAKNISSERFLAAFHVWNKNFRFFSNINFKEFCNKNKTKKFKQILMLKSKFKTNFLCRRNLVAVFFGSNNFCKFQPYFKRALGLKDCCQNPGGFVGKFFEIFSLKSVKLWFSQNPCIYYTI